MDDEDGRTDRLAVGEDGAVVAIEHILPSVNARLISWEAGSPDNAIQERSKHSTYGIKTQTSND